MDYLRQRIAERRAHIGDLKRQMELASAELRAYEDALAHIGGASGSNHELVATTTRPPPPPSHWPSVIAALGRRGDSFTIDDVVAELSTLGKTPLRKSIRSKLTELVKEKKVQRISDGVFTVPEPDSDAANEPSTED